MKRKILEVNHISTWFYTRDGIVKALQDVDFDLGKGEILGVVGESGCGKSVMAKSLIGLVDPPGKIVSGKIIYGGKELQNIPDRELRRLRGREIAYLLQNPMSAFNPMFTVLKHICDSILIHEKVKKKEAVRRAISLLGKTGFTEPEIAAQKYPHQFSGGMLQRAAIAMSIACNPRLLIADEPTTALDVSMQSQILQLLRELRDALGMSIIVITHNFGVVWDICDRVIVMYAGKVVESASVKAIYDRPAHPYTKALLDSVVSMEIQNDMPLPSIPGMVMDLKNIRKGCNFAPRCSYAAEYCREETPRLVETDKDHFTACFLARKKEMIG